MIARLQRTGLPVMIMPLFLCRNISGGMFNSLRCSSSSRNAQHSNSVAYLLPTQSAIEDVAALHSAARELKDIHMISGTLGAGKSTFCRAYIRYACDDEELAVPSPTYTLLNTYEEEIMEGPPIHHLDLYRLHSTAGQHRLQMHELWLSGATLIEWPERLEEKPAAYFSTLLCTCSQGDATALQEMTKAWGTAAVPAPHTTESGGDDQRWRILAIAGHGVDVQARHELGMQQLKDLQIDPDFVVIPKAAYNQVLSLQCASDMAAMLL